MAAGFMGDNVDGRRFQALLLLRVTCYPEV
jgi:hypothetical protein